MQTLVSVVNSGERKMLCALIVMGYGGFGLLRHGHTTLPAYREHLNYRGMSFKRNRVSPYRSLQGEDQPQGGSMAMWVWERERKRMLRCNSADRGCVACSGQHHVAGNGADFSPVLALEIVYGTDAGSKANDDGASRWCGFPHAW